MKEWIVELKTTYSIDLRLFSKTGNVYEEITYRNSLLIITIQKTPGNESFTIFCQYMFGKDHNSMKSKPQSTLTHSN